MDGRAWQATVHRVSKSQTQLKRCSMHAHTQEQLNFIYMDHVLPDCFGLNIFFFKITVIIIIMLYTINIIIIIILYIALK